MVGYLVRRAADQQQSHVIPARIGERVRVVQGDVNGIAGADGACFVADSHLARAIQDVINFLGNMVLMASDSCARRQDFFGQTAQCNGRRGAVY